MRGEAQRRQRTAHHGHAAHRQRAGCRAAQCERERNSAYCPELARQKFAVFIFPRAEKPHHTEQCGRERLTYRDAENRPLGSGGHGYAHKRLRQIKADKKLERRLGHLRHGGRDKVGARLVAAFVCRPERNESHRQRHGAHCTGCGRLAHCRGELRRENVHYNTARRSEREQNQPDTPYERAYAVASAEGVVFGENFRKRERKPAQRERHHGDINGKSRVVDRHSVLTKYVGERDFEHCTENFCYRIRHNEDRTRAQKFAFRHLPHLRRLNVFLKKTLLY